MLCHLSQKVQGLLGFLFIQRLDGKPCMDQDVVSDTGIRAEVDRDCSQQSPDVYRCRIFLKGYNLDRYP